MKTNKGLIKEKRDSERFLQIVAPQYLGVYVVNRKTDSFHDIIGLDYFRSIVNSQTDCYSQAMQIYKECYVKQDCWGTIDYALDYNTIYSILNKGEKVVVTYFKTNGQLIKLVIQPYSNLESEKDLSIWMYSIVDVNEENIELIRQKRLSHTLEELRSTNQKLEEALAEVEREKNILDQLCKDFSGVYDVDLNSGKFKILKLSERTNVKQLFDKNLDCYKDFGVCIQDYCDAFVVEEDQEAFLAWFDFKYLKEQFTKTDRIAFHYQSVPNLEQKHFFEVQVVQVKSNLDEFRVLVGFRYIDDILEVERENQNILKKSLDEAKLKNEIISAIGKTFQYISRVDVENDYYEEIMGNDELRMSYDNRSGKSSENSKVMCEKRVSKEFQKGFMAFTDLTTLPKRLAHKEMVDFEYRVNDGNWRIMWFIVKKRNENNRVTHVLCAIRSISAEKRKEQKLLILADEAREESRLKTKFLSDMSHDMRTPLNGILGILEMANRNPSDMKYQRDCREKIERVTKQLVSMINDILEMNKLETESRNMIKETFDLAQILRVSNEKAQQQASKKGIEYSIDWDKSSYEHQYLVGNPLYCARILDILADNAIKFSNPKSLITVWCKEEKVDEEHSMFEFGCQDHGVGMSEDFLKKAFDAFSQENPMARTKYEGMGLGLSIAKKMADLMSAKIELISKKGEGTIAIFRIPFKIGQERVDINSKNYENISVEGLRALVVEDNELNMEIIKFILEECNIEMECVKDGVEAITMFEQSPLNYYDVILMDIMMPKLNGLDATRKIRALSRKDAHNVPIIAMSANAFSEDIMSSRIAGIDYYVTKPIDKNHLIQSIKKGLVKYAK